MTRCSRSSWTTDRILYGSGLIGTELAGPGVCVSKPEKGIQMHFGAVRNNPKADAAGKALEACFQRGRLQREL